MEAVARPVESHSGVQETIIAGPYHKLILYAPTWDVEGRKGRKRGEGCPLTIRLDVWGSTIALPAGSGQSPSRKWILCISEVRKKPSGTPFSVFLSDGRAPKRHGPRKTFPHSPPLDGPGYSIAGWTVDTSDRSSLWQCIRQISQNFTGRWALNNQNSEHHTY